MRPLTVDDRDAVGELLKQHPREQSELTFTNLFIWRDAYQLQLSEVDGALAIFSWRADPEDSFVFPPLGEGANAAVVRRCLEQMRASGHAAVMARATEADLQRLGVTDGEFVIDPDRDNWDYVYLVEDLIALAGSRYHRKRNHIEQFKGQYHFEYVTLTPELAPACQELQDKWCDEKHCDLVATLRAENSAIKEVLENFQALGVSGGCIAIDGKVEAFALGELLNPDTVVIHIEKANAAFRGLYQAINQQFLEHEWSHIRHVNREQDLGVEGLRKAKESYYPDHMVEKCTVRLQ
jgi:hypothetical protein